MRKKVLFSITVGLVVSLFVSLFAFSASAAIPQTEIKFSQFTSGTVVVEGNNGTTSVGNPIFSDNQISVQQTGPLSPSVYFQAIRMNCNISIPVGSNNDIITVAFKGKTTIPILTQSGCNFIMRLVFEDAHNNEYIVNLGESVGLNQSGTTNLDLTTNFTFPNVIGLIQLKAVEFLYTFNSPISALNITITRSSFWVKSIVGSAQEAISDSTQEIIGSVVGDVTEEDTSNLDNQITDIYDTLGEIETITPNIEEFSNIFADIDQNYLNELDFATYGFYWLEPLWQYFLPVAILTILILFGIFKLIFYGKG